MSDNPFVQQRELAHGRAVVVRDDRAVLRVSGPDRFTWLDGLVTQSVAQLSAGESIEALVLSPQGRVEHQMALVDDGDNTLIITSSARITELLTFLDGMIFRENVSLEILDDVAVVGTMAGPARDRVVGSGESVITWFDPWRDMTRGGYQYAHEPHPGSTWTYAELVVPRSLLAALRSSSPQPGVLEVPASALLPLRIAAWRPDLETEADATLIPHEVDWLRSAVHLSKGCYRGQETVAKVHNLGAPPRRLVMLHLDGINDAVPLAGADVSDGDRVVGHVTVAARHYEDGVIALALIKRTTDESTELSVATEDGLARAGQVTIVPVTAGHVADVPRLGSLTSRFREPRSTSQP